MLCGHNDHSLDSAWKVPQTENSLFIHLERPSNFSFSEFVSMTFGRVPWTISMSHGTPQNRKKCRYVPEWDYKSWSQCPSGTKLTPWPLWSCRDLYEFTIMSEHFQHHSELTREHFTHFCHCKNGDRLIFLKGRKLILPQDLLLLHIVNSHVPVRSRQGRTLAASCLAPYL